ncbi:ABC transporter substrate-binding protein [Paracoccus laeviglucosivorans]|uniref:Amino acid ABC transporter substrate-binding protein, PAAT family n=1 Tax=Paracoccus laeviglucosivorans TaxID=1197861 RepID=A0A521FKD9_9RHOB|nr:ABC transporter substrate-binding protein [Paracoccus laeviglucosivorans]SMO96579.1 amino acid ABC transporter substrate-binding protein, PAAT family [Paracoccus laeviglucosivorans]
MKPTLGAAVLAAAFLAVAGPVAAQTCTPAISDKHLVEPGKLMLSINPTNPPQQFVDEKGELQGLNVELAAEIAKRLCIQIELVRMDFPAMIPAMNAGRIDGLNTGMFWNEERSKLMYTVPYSQQSISVAVLPDSDVQMAGDQDLLGKSSAVEVNSYQMAWLKKFSDAAAAEGKSAVEVRSFPTASNVVAALRARQVDNAVLVDSVARDLVGRGQVKEVLSGLGKTRATLAFRDKAVADAIVTALNDMRKDGSYDALFQKFSLTPLAQDEPLEIAGPGPAQ